MPRLIASTHTFTLNTVLTAALLLALSGCGGGDSGSSGGSSSSGGSGSSTSSGSGSSSACNYTDLISASERAQSNACGIQVSGAYGTADSHLNQVISACKLGEKAKADDHYNNVYKKAVQYARDNSKALSCGTGGGTSVVPPPSTPTYYNMCGKVSGNTRTGRCYGPVRKDEGGCGSDDGFTYISQYSSSNACIGARDSWLNSK